ncbi:MAG: RNA polymerase sigma-70 factor [Gemmatimonadales bacterium]
MNGPPNGPDPDDIPDDAEELQETARRAAQLSAGDVEAFKGLFDMYFDRLHRYALRYLRSSEESQDLVHDVFLRIWRQRRRIGLERDLRSYLYASTRNLALDRLKHRKVEDRFIERGASAQAGGENAADSTDTVRDLESRELAASIQQAIDTLPRRQREVLRLRWQQHLSYNEVAEALNISPKTVAIHLSRAFEHLRRTLPGLID